MSEWYRQTEWNDEIDDFFFDKLSRARSQRDQYIVIQALTLSQSFPEVALRLVDYYFETRTDDFHDGRARVAASNARFAMGGYEQALDEYLEGMTGDNSEGGLLVGSPIKFAFLTARYRSQKHYLPALDVLDGLDEPPETALEVRFMYLTSYALILHESGKDPLGAVPMAEQALAMPQELISTFADVVWRLRGVTRS
ncbi:hypothetical protein [Altererythrobacter sp. MF3-039]|uniref:hypothetical protein n=1 Tax=Altererythrobacter sp. MF3-039 TaxID=3252901 RepID=UPI00390C840C